MKYVIFSLLSIFLIVTLSFSGELKFNNKSESDLLRIHIRANSNDVNDQKIKYEIKDCLLNFISGDISLCKTKSEVEEYFKDNKITIEEYINQILKLNGYNYKSNVKLANEYFPTRAYGEYLVEKGFYDAIIIELGTAQGENWWCVAYPPLCFYDYSEKVNNVVYKSRFMDIINKILNKWGNLWKSE